MSGSILLATRSNIPNQELVNSFGLEPVCHTVLSISDDGPGIAERDLEHIFEPFYTKRAMGKTGGTVLGLSVVWNTMRDHQGAAIAISSSAGTTFDLYFPTTSESNVAHNEQQPDSEQQPDRHGNGEKILVVDDEPQQCDLAKRILEHYGYKVDCRDSGEQAIDYMQSHRVDLIILDMIMAPGINGRRTYEEIITIHPGQKAIIASGFSESEDVKAALRMGAGDFIKKPYSMTELADTVKNALQK